MCFPQLNTGSKAAAIILHDADNMSDHSVILCKFTPITTNYNVGDISRQQCFKLLRYGMIKLIVCFMIRGNR